ncbi:MAG: hybrid sensor histidine kinase/response regulator [Geminicoccaceae bacterium]
MASDPSQQGDGDLQNELVRLRKINAVLIDRVERSMNVEGADVSLFETAVLLEGRVKERTAALENALRDLRRSNQALDQARAEAERANASKTRFLAAAGHDILQPLNAARLFLSALSETEQTRECQRLIANVDLSFEAVERLIGALLDISKLDAGVLKPEMSVVSLEELMTNITTQFGPIAQDRGLKLVHVPCQLTVRTDPNLLTRVLRNLLSNAIRYTQRGRVLLGCRRSGSRIRIEVHDSGIGMPQDKLDEVFEEFRRLGSGGESLDRGFGHGLAIVKRITTLLDHPISVQSKHGQGTCFAVTLPVVEAPVPAKPARPPAASDIPVRRLSGSVVCVIENEPAVLEAMRVLLTSWSCEVVVAATQMDAQMRLAKAGMVPDMVIADFHLDDGATGVDAVAEMQMRYQMGLPGIIVTADRTTEVREKVLNAGLKILHKPVRAGRLRALVTHLLQIDGLAGSLADDATRRIGPFTTE